MILQTFDAILQRIAFAMQFMGFFSLISGLLVLTSMVVTSRYQRIRENVLLRTLGASQRQLRYMLTIEYLFLGAFAALAGLLLAILGGWVLARFLFEVAFTVSARFLVLAWLLVIVVTVVVGLLGCRGVTSRPPLEVLRDDG
jgi:putative ABC transport system permease protein